MNSHKTPCRAFMLADVIIALAVVVILGGALAVSLSRRQRVSDHLADSRAATRLAEQVLTALQSGQALPADDALTSIAVTPAAGAADVGGLRWVNVQVARNGRSALLIGLAPLKAVPATRPAMHSASHPATPPITPPPTPPAESGGPK